MKQDNLKKSLDMARSYSLDENAGAEIYSSIRKLIDFESKKGVELSFDEALGLWDKWIGYPIYITLKEDTLIKALFGERRFGLFHELLRLTEENRFVFSEDIAIESAKKRHLKELISSRRSA